MHIPDGYLDTKTILSTWIISISFLTIGIKRVKEKLKDKTIPLMGVLGALIFASQMVNFPIIYGTSGHFLGGVILGIILGPFAGLIIMIIVLILQSLIFGDGGVLTLGANILNIGIIGTFLSTYIYYSLNKIFKNKIYLTAFIASWISVILSSVFCSFELSISKMFPLSLGLISMIGIHSIIGFFEGLITSIILVFIYKNKKELSIFTGINL